MPRPNAPWWRTDRRQWFATVRGKKMPLGVHDPNDLRGAIEALNRLLNPPASPGAGECDKPPTPCYSPGAGETVAARVPGYEREVVTHLQPVTRASYRSRLRWLVRLFGERPVSAVDPAEVERAARGAGWRNNTRRHTLLVCQHFFKWAGRKDFALRKPPPESRGGEAVITPDQFEELLRYANGDFRPYLKFLWLTGCRPSEACGLTVDQVDWQNGTAVLKKHKTAHKGKRRVLYLSRDVLALLEGQRAKWQTGHLFRGRQRKPFNAINVAARFRRLQLLSGVLKTAYCSRHSFITRMLEAGASDSDVAALVGHSGTNVIHRTYSHIGLNAKRLRDVAGRLDGSG